MTGDELIAFISQEQCTLPDGTQTQGLIPYLRGLAGEGRQQVVATVFQGVINRMINGQ